MFKFLFITIFAFTIFTFEEINLILKLTSFIISVGALLFIEYYLIRKVEFYKILTTSILIVLFFSIIFFFKSILSLETHLPLNSSFSSFCLTHMILFATYSAFQIGVSSLYFRKKIPKSENPLQFALVDTCAIIDGRILDISKSGFMPKSIVVPEFVIREMQLISDSTIHEKRLKGRKGLDFLKIMKNSDTVSIQITKEDYPKIKGVDNKLLQMAKDKKAKIITTDYNLVKVAEVEGVEVLNINQLAFFLKPTLAIGDKVKVAISKKGNNKKQGIGYLENDTMVVIEDGEKYIGSSKMVLITSYIQNDSGRIAFCKLLSGNNSNNHS